MNKEDMVHICDGIFLSYNKEKKTTQFAAARMDLETVTLNEVRQRKTNII